MHRDRTQGLWLTTAAAVVRSRTLTFIPASLPGNLARTYYIWGCVEM
jgi:hypothetical protein